MKKRNDFITKKIKSCYPDKSDIYLHEPVFFGNEKKYLSDAIDSTYVSSIGPFVNKIESKIQKYTSVSNVIATVNGTSALHLSLNAAGVKKNDEVLTQSLTFVAPINAITYQNAIPVFLDVNKDNFGLSCESLINFLEKYGDLRQDGAYNKLTGRRIKACIVVHVFGFIGNIDEIVKICNDWKISLIEDASEALGSFYKKRSAGSFGSLSSFSFNGNKIITSGGGGVVLTNDDKLGALAKHLSTQAKINHSWNFFHDKIGYNYRMPNINAALLLAQFENLEKIKCDKKELFTDLKYNFGKQGIDLVEIPENNDWNYWLFSIRFDSKEERDSYLKYSHNNNIYSRPPWDLIHTLPMFNNYQAVDLTNSINIAEKIANIPSGARF